MNSKHRLHYIRYEDMGKDQGKIKHLFEHAFPIEERPSFANHIKSSRQEFYGVYYQNKFAALVDLIIYKDVVYLYFLAVKKSFRKKGIASQIIEDIFAKYNQDYRIYLLMEEVDPSYANYEERVARSNFYTKRGFNISPIKINEFEVIYSLLNNCKEVTFLDHMNLFKYFLEETGFYPVYKKNCYEVK